MLTGSILDLECCLLSTGFRELCRMSSVFVTPRRGYRVEQAVSDRLQRGLSDGKLAFLYAIHAVKSAS